MPKPPQEALHHALSQPLRVHVHRGEEGVQHALLVIVEARHRHVLRHPDPVPAQGLGQELGDLIVPAHHRLRQSLFLIPFYDLFKGLIIVELAAHQLRIRHHQFRDRFHSRLAHGIEIAVEAVVHGLINTAALVQEADSAHPLVDQVPDQLHHGPEAVYLHHVPRHLPVHILISVQQEYLNPPPFDYANIVYVHHLHAEDRFDAILQPRRQAQHILILLGHHRHLGLAVVAAGLLGYAVDDLVPVHRHIGLAQDHDPVIPGLLPLRGLSLPLLSRGCHIPSLLCVPQHHLPGPLGHQVIALQRHGHRVPGQPQILCNALNRNLCHFLPPLCNTPPALWRNPSFTPRTLFPGFPPRPSAAAPGASLTARSP